MFQTEPFLNQREARDYVDAIEDPTEQLLMRVLHNGALGRSSVRPADVRARSALSNG